MPGTNASLNGLETYGFNADTFVLTSGDFLAEEYKESWPNVQFINFNAFMRHGKDAGYYFRFADLQFGLELFDRYDVILFWGGDLCVLDNFMEYFEIAGSLDALVLGTNEHGSNTLASLGKEWPYAHTWSVPYADVPFFVPGSQMKVLKTMLEWSDRPNNKLSRMDMLNYVVRDLKCRVHAVPGELWIQNVPYRYSLKHDGNGVVYIKDSSTRLKSCHRKYWNCSVCRNYLPGGTPPWTEISRSNKRLFNRLYTFFNRECRVSWTEGLEVWDGK